MPDDVIPIAEQIAAVHYFDNVADREARKPWVGENERMRKLSTSLRAAIAALGTHERVVQERDAARAELAGEKPDHELTCKMHGVTINQYEALRETLSRATTELAEARAEIERLRQGGLKLGPRLPRQPFAPPDDIDDDRPPEDAMEAARQARIAAERDWNMDSGSLNGLIDVYNARAITAAREAERAKYERVVAAAREMVEQPGLRYLPSSKCGGNAGPGNILVDALAAIDDADK